MGFNDMTGGKDLGYIVAYAWRSDNTYEVYCGKAADLGDTIAFSSVSLDRFSDRDRITTDDEEDSEYDDADEETDDDEGTKYDYWVPFAKFSKKEWAKKLVDNNYGKLVLYKRAIEGYGPLGNLDKMIQTYKHKRELERELAQDVEEDTDEE